MLLYKEDLDNFKINTKEDLLNFFIYTFEFTLFPPEFLEEIKGKIDTLHLSLNDLWIYLQLEYDLYMTNFYPHQFLKNSILKTQKEISNESFKNNFKNKYQLDFNDYFENQLECFDMVFDELGINPLIERPILKLLFVEDDESKIFQILNNKKDDMINLLSKYQSFFSTVKFNKDRLLKRKDLDFYQEEVVDYLEIWMIQIFICYDDVKNITSETDIIDNIFDIFYKNYFKKMSVKNIEDFKKTFSIISIEILKKLYELK